MLLSKLLIVTNKLSTNQNGLVEGVASRAKDFLVLAFIHFGELVPGLAEVLAWVEEVWVLSEHPPDGAGHDDTAIRVDVDLADGALGGLSELGLWDTDGIWHVTAVLVDHLDVVLWDGGGTVENDWEAWELLLDLVEDVKPDLGLGAGWELVSAVGSADGDGEGVDAGLLDEVLNLFWAGVDVAVSLDIVFDTSENAEFTFDGDVVFPRVGEVADLLGEGDVLLVAEVGTVDHDRAEAVLDAGLAKLEGVTVVEVENDWDDLVLWVDLTSVLDSTLGHVAEHGGVSVLTGTSGDLEDDWGLSPDAGGDDSLELLHLGEVVSWDSVTAVDGLSEHVLGVDEAKSLVRDSHYKCEVTLCELCGRNFHSGFR